MHKRLFSFVLLFLLFFGLAIGNNLLSNLTPSFVTATLPSADSMMQLLLNPDVAPETNSWIEQLANEWEKPSSLQVELTLIANLNFNQIIDRAIAEPPAPDILSGIVLKG